MDDYKSAILTEQNSQIKDRSIVALFADHEDARAAEQALKDAGYDDVDITQNKDETSADFKQAHEHSFWDSVKSFFGNHDDAHTYGEGVRRGEIMVTVHTEQSRADQAADILDRFNATDIEGAVQAWRNDGWAVGGSDMAVSGFDSNVAGRKLEELPPTTEFVNGNDGDGANNASGISGRDPETGNTRVRSYQRYPSVETGPTLRLDSRAFDGIPADQPENGTTAFPRSIDGAEPDTATALDDSTSTEGVVPTSNTDVLGTTPTEDIDADERKIENGFENDRDRNGDDKI